MDCVSSRYNNIGKLTEYFVTLFSKCEFEDLKELDSNLKISFYIMEIFTIIIVYLLLICCAEKHKNIYDVYRYTTVVMIFICFFCIYGKKNEDKKEILEFLPMKIFSHIMLILSNFINICLSIIIYLQTRNQGNDDNNIEENNNN